MNVTVNVPVFAQELRLLNQVVAQKPPLPILSNVLIRAELDQLYLATTDMEIAFSTVCKAVVGEPGVVTLPVKRLLDIVERLSDADVQIVTDKAHVHVRSGAFRGRLQTLSPDDFPTVPEPSEEPSMLPTVALQTMVGRVRYAVSDKTKYTVNGALLTLTDTLAALVSTDGKRLVVTSMPFSGQPTSVIIPTKTLDVLSALFNDAQIAFSKGERHLFFQAGERMLASRMLEAKFPAYQRIIPQDTTKKATADRSALAAALRRVGIVSEENQACYLSFSESTLDITSSSAMVGDAAERVVIGYEGEPLSVCCSWQFVLDFLEAASGQLITISLKDANNPMLLTDGEDHLAVIMLMRM
jgi:DNA polymerase-3 subunit beta